MSVQITLHGLRELKQFRNNLRVVKQMLAGFYKDTLQTVGEEVVLSTILRKMNDAGYSDKIILNTALTDVSFTDKGKAKLKFESTFIVASGFDIAEGREKGTKPHLIEGDPLVFKINGTTIFVTKVDHPGQPATYIIRDTSDELSEELQRRIDEELERFVKNVLSSGR